MNQSIDYIVSSESGSICNLSKAVRKISASEANYITFDRVGSTGGIRHINMDNLSFSQMPIQDVNGHQNRGDRLSNRTAASQHS